MADFFVVSNRGPFGAIEAEPGVVSLKRGAGGLVTALLPLVRSKTINWVFPISAPAELAALELGLYSQDLDGIFPVVLDAQTHEAAYNKISNELLWYLNHGMFSLSRGPSFDSALYSNWHLYRNYSQVMAEFLAQMAPSQAKVMLQDYHMFLVAGDLAALRPDIEISLFLHTPFATPSEFAILPDSIATELLTSLGTLGHFGFHCTAWRDNYLATAANASISTAARTWVNPLGSDLDELEAVRNGESATVQVNELRKLASGRKVIARVDRMEPSKNILRGIDAVVEMLKFYPHLINKVVHIANCYPSREGVDDYADYAREVAKKASSANRYLRELAGNLGIPVDADPILVFNVDDYPLSLAVLSIYDVLLVNPIRDGFNLVASEGPLLNASDGTLILSANAGIAEVIGDAAIVVNPFDVRETALAIYHALQADQVPRRQRALRLKERLSKRNSRTWFGEQMNWFENR